jgi:hypothetical protein
MDKQQLDIVDLYFDYKDSVYEKIDFENNYIECKYKDKCTRIHNKFHGYHLPINLDESKRQEDYEMTKKLLLQELHDKQIVLAKKFTNSFLEYSYNSSENTPEGYDWKNTDLNRLISDIDNGLKILNEKKTILSDKYKVPYTIDKPNFALLISIVLNHDDYKNIYGESFMSFLCLQLDEFGLTGVFDKKGYVFLENNYPNVFKILKKRLIGKRFGSSHQHISYHQISNSSVAILFESEKTKDHDSSDPSQSSFYRDHHRRDRGQSSPRRDHHRSGGKKTRKKKKSRKSRKRKSRKRKSRKRKSRKRKSNIRVRNYKKKKSRKRKSLI